jgi:molecular chaperone GrpE
MNEENENNGENGAESETPPPQAAEASPESAANDDSVEPTLEGAPPDPAEEIARLKDRLLRTMAELENTRRRGEKEKSEAAQFGIANFARDLLSVSDNLRRAIESVPPEASEGAADALKNLIDGVELTERELISVFERNGMTPIEPAGEKFNAHLHQAIAQVPGSGQAAGTVVDVVQVGYTIGERLLRAAMVTIAAGESKKPDGDDNPGGRIDTTA